MQEFNNKLNSIGEWIIRLVFLNFLWIGGSIVGLGILGVFPATSALFSVLRRWFLKDKRVKIAPEFFKYYKKDFWKSNALGYVLLLISYVILTDYRFISSVTEFWTFAAGYFMLILLAFSLFSLCILFPIYSHLQVSFFQYIKNALFFPLLNIIPMIVMGASLFIIQFIYSHVPGIVLFIGVSFPAFIILKIVFPVLQGKKLSVGDFFKIFKKSKDESVYY